MSEIEIINEKPLLLAELKEKLADAHKKNKEPSFRSTKTKEYLDMFATDSKKAKEAFKKISDLNVGRLKDRHIVKIIDIYPEDMNSLKAIFTGENLTLKTEDLKRILECLK
ncbi:MAG TPA: hypothetical protein VJC07_04600 [Candidatus Nanoarchaeia archaeon]|nr:hypothetical protein [Candidatus Nanoarchaeia archaeon]